MYAFCQSESVHQTASQTVKILSAVCDGGGYHARRVADHLCVNDLDRGLSDKERIRAAADIGFTDTVDDAIENIWRIRKASSHTLRFVICMIWKACGRR